VTLELCQSVIDRSAFASEAEIMDAMRRVHQAKGWLMEGAAAVALAAFLKDSGCYENKTVAVLICGGNVSQGVRRQALG